MLGLRRCVGFSGVAFLWLWRARCRGSSCGAWLQGLADFSSCHMWAQDLRLLGSGAWTR